MELFAGVAPVQHSDGNDWFERIYVQHADRIYGWLLVRGVNQPDARDITAQVFLEAWRQRDCVVIDPELGWLPWLYRVARNLTARQYRVRRAFLTRTLMPAGSRWMAAGAPMVVTMASPSTS